MDEGREEEEEYVATQGCSQSYSQEVNVSSGDRERPVGRLVPLSSTRDHINIKPGQPVEFGRMKTCTEVFDLPTVSGIHCRFTCKEDAGHFNVYLEDCSSNGTYVDGKRIGKGKTHLLRTGQLIMLRKPSSMNHIPRKLTYMFEDCALVDEDPTVSKLYTIVKDIGKGNFSVVKKGLDRKTAAEVAIKIVPKTASAYGGAIGPNHKLTREVEVLKRVEHVNVTRLLNFIDGSKNMYLILEYANGGELFDAIRREVKISERQSRRIFKQLLLGVQHLHNVGVVHRDLKPENVLLHYPKGDRKEPAIVKITDFGLARIADPQKLLTTQCGTPHYVAPEVLSVFGNQTQPAVKGYDKAVDMWSLGVILYILLCGRSPWSEREEAADLFEQIAKGMVFFPDDLWGGVSASAKRLIKGLLKVDVKERLNVQAALEHDWMVDPSLSSVLRPVGTVMQQHPHQRSPQASPHASPRASPRNASSPRSSPRIVMGPLPGSDGPHPSPSRTDRRRSAATAHLPSVRDAEAHARHAGSPERKQRRMGFLTPERKH